MRLYEEFKLYETMWNENLTYKNNEFVWEDSPERLDKTVTKCDNCGKEIANGMLPLERNLPAQLGFDRYLYNAFGKNLCWACMCDSKDFSVLSSFISKLSDFQTAIKYFNKNDLNNFRYHTGMYSDPNKYYVWWADNQNRLVNFSQEEKDNISSTLDTHKQMFNSAEYKSYLSDLAAKQRAYEEEEKQKALKRAPKTTVNRNRYVYMVLQDFDNGSFEIIFVDKNLTEAKRQFKKAIFDFIVEGIDADAKMFLFKINIAAIQDDRLLALFKDYLGDSYYIETPDEYQKLLYEYRDAIWKDGWAKCLVQCNDNEAVEECYDQGLDPNDLAAKNEWEDFVRDYIDSAYSNI